MRFLMSSLLILGWLSCTFGPPFSMYLMYAVSGLNDWTTAHAFAAVWIILMLLLGVSEIRRRTS